MAAIHQWDKEKNIDIHGRSFEKTIPEIDVGFSSYPSHSTFRDRSLDFRLLKSSGDELLQARSLPLACSNSSQAGTSLSIMLIESPEFIHGGGTIKNICARIEP